MTKSSHRIAKEPMARRVRASLRALLEYLFDIAPVVLAGLSMIVLAPPVVASLVFFADRFGAAEVAVFLMAIFGVFYIWRGITRVHRRRASAGDTDSRLTALQHLTPSRAALGKEFTASVADASCLHHRDGAPLEEIRRTAEKIAEATPPRHWSGTSRRARHEAAHALIAHLSGGTIISAHIVHDENVAIGGSVHSSGDGTGATGDETEWSAAKIAIAGDVQDGLDGVRDWGARTDMEQGAGRLTQLLAWGVAPAGHDRPLTYEGLLLTARVEVEKLLRQHADVVAAIAQRLEVAADPLTERDLVDLWPKPDGRLPLDTRFLVGQGATSEPRERWLPIAQGPAEHRGVEPSCEEDAPPTPPVRRDGPVRPEGAIDAHDPQRRLRGLPHPRYPARGPRRDPHDPQRGHALPRHRR